MADVKKKRNKLIHRCPVCSGELTVTHLKCTDCGSELSGEFVANEFARLPEDKLLFLRTFLICRGNLKEVEAALGISYPTVRGRLDQLLEALSMLPQDEHEVSTDDKAAILEALERGELTVEQAEQRLRG
jgi:hypothetical protein